MFDWTQKLEQKGYVIFHDQLQESLRLNLANELDDLTGAIGKGDQKPKDGDIYWETIPSTTSDNKRSVFLIGDLSAYSDLFYEWIHSKEMQHCVRAILGDQAYQFEFCQALIKNPYSNRNVGWHRDFPNQALPRQNSRCVRICLCLDPQTQANGCLKVIRGSHLVTDAEARVQAKNQLPRWSSEDEIPLECSKGSIILLHPKIIHGSGVNKTHQPRRLITFAWAHSANKLVDTPAEYLHLGLKPTL